MVSVVLLIVNDDLNKELHYLSQKFSGISLFGLNQDNLPHITLAQFSASPEESNNLWDQVKNLKNAVHELSVGGVNLSPSFNHRQTWIELQILNSVALRELHQSVINIEFSKSHELINASNDQFRPHITLGLVDSLKFDINFNFDPRYLVFKTPIKVRLAVGINGEYFTFNKIIED